MYKLITVLICIIFGCIAMISVIMLENIKLRDENKKLNEMVDTYKWQIEQIPYVIEGNLDSWCHGGYQ